MRQFFVHITCLLTWLGVCSPTYAQMQQGYDSERPNIVVDRSVLEDLKGYEPPAMFEDNDNTEAKPVPSLAKPISKPLSSAPNAEALLSYPTQNFRVLTERKSQVKDIKPKQKSSSPSPPVKIEQKASVPPQKEVRKAKDNIKIEAKKTVALPETEILSHKNSLSKVPAYKPKASPTMPAIPPISVERDVLPALPPANPESQNISAPSIGERMIDAALERQIEKDNEKIKEKLAEESNNLVKKSKSAQIDTQKKSDVPLANNSLVFEVGQTDLTKTLEAKILTKILPELTHDLNSRIQILSFATAPDKTEKTAKRLSLARALSVRDYLKKMNIDVSRIDVRALATDSSPPPDRVDIILTK